MKTFFIVFLFILVSIPQSVAQVPGTWVKHQVCIHCTSPLTAAFANTNDGYVMGSRSWRGRTNTFRTTDAGKIWSHFSDTVQVIHYDSITFGETIIFDSKFTDAPILYDSSGAIIIITDNGTCISRDTGRNWTVWRPLRRDIQSGFIQDASSSVVLTTYIYNVYTSRLQLMISHDSGKSYQLSGQEYSVGGNTSSSCVEDSSNAWFSISKRNDPHYTLYHTIDGGLSWNAVYPVDTTLMGKFYYEIMKGAAKNTIYLVSSDSGLQILGQNYDFLYTTDGGISWGGTWGIRRNIFWNSHYVLRNPRDEDVWCVLDDQHTIAYSSNNGTDWAYDSVTFKNDAISDMIWQDSVHAYILGYKDSTINLYMYVPPANSAEAPSSSEDEISVYPNPISSSATISYSLLSHQYIKLELIDQLGRVVHLLRSEFEDAGAKNISLSLSEIPTGMYYLRLQSSADVITKKVIVAR